MTALLVLIYVAFISLGLPDSLLGSVWPAMHADLGADLSQIALIQVLRAAYVVAVMPPLILGFIQWIG